jgi:hypothetical protein
MSICRKPYPSDVSPGEWSLIAPYLLLQREDAGQWAHDLRGVQRSALHPGDRCALALNPERPSALGGGIPADSTVAGGRMLRSAGRRPARGVALGGGPQARHYRELSQSLEQHASFAESHGFNLSEDLRQDLARYYDKQVESSPKGVLPGLWETNLSSSQEGMRNAAIAKWSNQRSEGIERDIQSALSEQPPPGGPGS